LSTQENAAVVRRFVDEVITQRNLDSAAQFVWQDVVEQVPFPVRSMSTRATPARMGQPKLVL